MFGIFKRKNTNKGKDYFPFKTDIHSHILPGIDDGSPDIEASIMLIRGLMELGVNKSIATPHIIGDMYRNSADTIFPALQLLKDELACREMEFEVSAAAEYMLDAYFFELLNNKTPLLTLEEKTILTEFSYSSVPTSTERMSFSIITEGYTPILAHPERYSYYYHDFNEYFRLKELGFLLQVNLLSLTGYYGKDAAKAANFILKNDLASFVATDLHHPRHFEALQDPRNRTIFKEVLGHRDWNVEF